MKTISYVEYVEAQEQSRKQLEEIVKSIHKRSGNNVPYNFIMQALDCIDKTGEYKAQYGVIVKELKEECRYKYICDDIDELEEMKTEQGDCIIEQDGLNLIVKGNISSYIVEHFNSLGEVITAQEAAELIGVTEAAIRKAITSGKLVLGRDYRKAGRITLIKRQAVLDLKK